MKNQGSCGSCYAFAFITLLEAQNAFQFTYAANLSEQQIVDCSTYDSGCGGGYFTNTFWYFSNNPSLWRSNYAVSYPYKQKASTCAFKDTTSIVLLNFQNWPMQAFLLIAPPLCNKYWLRTDLSGYRFSSVILQQRQITILCASFIHIVVAFCNHQVAQQRCHQQIMLWSLSVMVLMQRLAFLSGK